MGITYILFNGLLWGLAGNTSWPFKSTDHPSKDSIGRAEDGGLAALPLLHADDVREG